VDWNNDGKKDLVAGDSSGQVWLFLNGGTDKAPVLAPAVPLKEGGKTILGQAPDYQRSMDGTYRMVAKTNTLMGIYSKIHVGDWNGDGLKDLLVGQDGPGNQNMLLYLNVGTASEPVLAAPVSIDGMLEPKLSRPSPYLVDWDGDGKQDLLCGTEQAAVYFFRNIGTAQQPKFARGVPLKLKGGDFASSYRCRIEVTDWNNDGKLDLLVGTACSGAGGTRGNVWLFLGQ